MPKSTSKGTSRRTVIERSIARHTKRKADKSHSAAYRTLRKKTRGK